MDDLLASGNSGHVGVGGSGPPVKSCGGAGGAGTVVGAGGRAHGRQSDQVHRVVHGEHRHTSGARTTAPGLKELLVAYV